MGGFTENTLKNEKGLRFLLPFESILLTKAMGLGVIAADKYWYIFAVSPDVRSIVLIIF
jgi:hypothetical protein